MTYRHTARCSRRGEACSYDYPFDYNARTHIVETNAGPRLVYRRRNAEADANVVSYNARVLSLWDGHANVVAILDMRVFEYLLAYVLKGLDEVTVILTQGGDGERDDADVEEIRTYVANRYMGACEAVMVLFGGRSYPVVSLSPPVVRLRVAVPTADGFVVLDEDSLLGLSDAAVVDSMLSRRVTDVHRWLARPLDPEFDDVGFVAYFERYVVHNDRPRRDGTYWTDTHIEHPGYITRRSLVGRGRGTIARIVRVPRSSGEPWFLSVILRRGNPLLGTGAQARDWDGLRLLGGSLRDTFEDVARGLGYVQLHEEGRTVMQEMRVFGASPRAYRTTFCIFAVDGNDMRSALEEFGEQMSRDFRGGRSALLRDLDRTLQFMGSSLEQCNLPPVGRGQGVSSQSNPLVYRVRQELDQRRRERGDEFRRLRPGLNAEQGAFVDAVFEDLATGRVRARYIDALPTGQDVHASHAGTWPAVACVRAASRRPYRRLYRCRGVAIPRGPLGPRNRRHDRSPKV